jgi:hypothetical protein
MTTRSNQLHSPVDQSHSSTLWWQRKGILGWWLNMTAPPRPADMSPLPIREFIRKAELTSVIILAVFAYLVAIISNSLSDPSTAQAVIIMVVVLVIAIWLNRKGRTYIAAYTLIIAMISLIAFAVIGAQGGLRLIWFTTYDLFAIPIFASALILHKRMSLLFALIVAAFIIGDYSLHPHALITGMGANQFDEIAYELAQPYFNWWAMINRNVSIVIFSGILGWLAAFSFEKALAWAEQARNEATIAHALVDYKERSTQELSLFLNEVVEAFVAQANGQTKYLQPRPINDSFHQATLLLNERLRRFERLRRQQNIWSSDQVVQAIQQLTMLLGQIAAGRISAQALAPQHFHSQVEFIDELAAQIYTLLHARQTYPNRNVYPPGR